MYTAIQASSCKLQANKPTANKPQKYCGTIWTGSSECNQQKNIGPLDYNAVALEDGSSLGSNVISNNPNFPNHPPAYDYAMNQQITMAPQFGEFRTFAKMEKFSVETVCPQCKNNVHTRVKYFRSFLRF